MRGLGSLIAVGAQLGHLRPASETGPWSECVRSSVMCSLRAGWAQERSAFSDEGSFCLEDSELRIPCRSDVEPCCLFVGSIRRGKVQDCGTERADIWTWTADRALRIEKRMVVEGDSTG